MIRHLRHEHIDKQWWDQQLLRCDMPLWYARSWVLDATSPGWGALHDDETGAIMPLTWRKKYFIKYLFQPFGSQQLGVFVPNYDEAIGQRMLQAIPREYRYCDISLNERMGALNASGSRTTPRSQQVLLLDRPVMDLRNAYSEGHRRNLKKAVNDPLLINDITPDEFTALYARTTGQRYGVQALDLGIMQEVISQALERGECSIWGTRSDQELVAAACFIEWNGRAIFYKSGADPIGQEQRAMFRIIDAYIKKHAGSGVLLDFAGSDTPSVARFNAGFGAQRRIYLRLQRNLLPPPFRWFKQ